MEIVRILILGEILKFKNHDEYTAAKFCRS